MLGPIARTLSNIRMTAAISALVIASIIASIGIVTAALYLNLGSSVRESAARQQVTNMSVAATLFDHMVPGTEAIWSADGALERIRVYGMPSSFAEHDLVDSIGRVTGETATLFAWRSELNDFVRLTTNIVGADGERVIGTVLGEASAAYGPVLAGEAYFGQANILGVPYYTGYQPIFDMAGNVVGVLYVGIDRARVEAMIYESVGLMLGVGALALVVLGAAGFALSRALTRPVPALARTMKAIAEGDYAAEVPFTGRTNEIGDMARAVEVFRENGLRVSQMTEEERAAAIRRREERTDMMQALQAAFGEVVDAAVAGDFSKRVEAEFPDAELNALADSVNNLVSTVDRGLGETGAVLSALAETDLTRRVEGAHQGAFGRLKDDVNAVADTLGEIVGQLRGTSRSLKTATGEILSGANDLSERTTKQAGTIEETSAAMEQLAATVADNAQMAEDANAKARAVSESAAQSGTVMNDATAAMERITASSAKISNIIGMIDDIAFQTNLLALNASVEAARAGDAGKGFAVVAVEVRRLAQSAASASADVKTLIEQSADEVTGGSRLVAEAAERLASMLGAANENSALMAAIARASRDQASAIDEVSVAVRQMDEMTQHNAALVEQTNAAIEQTEAQARELDRIVEVFRIDAAQPEPAAPVAEPAPVPAARAASPTARRISSAKSAYLTNGNAAISEDWSEF